MNITHRVNYIILLLTVLLVLSLLVPGHLLAEEFTDYKIILGANHGYKRIDGICFDNNGNLIIACEGDSQVVKISPSGHVSIILDASSGLEQPEDVIADSDNNIFVSDDGTRAIFKIHPNGHVEKYLAESHGLIQPEGMAFDHAGNLYIADEEAHVIYKVNTSKAIEIYADYTAGFITPEDVTIDESGTLYIVDDDGGSVLQISPTKNIRRILSRADGLDEPESLILHKKNLYITDSARNIIFRHSLSTGTLETFYDFSHDESIRGLQGIAISDDGFVFASTSNGKVLQLTKKAFPD